MNSWCFWWFIIEGISYGLVHIRVWWFSSIELFRINSVVRFNVHIVVFYMDFIHGLRSYPYLMGNQLLWEQLWRTFVHWWFHWDFTRSVARLSILVHDTNSCLYIFCRWCARLYVNQYILHLPVHPLSLKSTPWAILYLWRTSFPIRHAVVCCPVPG